MFESITYNTENMYKSSLGGYTNATDAADWLVKKGVTFREAHEISGRLVLYAIEKKLPLEELSLNELKSISDVFDETVYKAISVETCVNARNVASGPAESAVNEAIEKAEEFLKSVSKTA
jgi:argininosuccinate lyase